MIQAPSVMAQDSPSEHELAVIAYINQARQAPLAVAESMGMDTDRILDDFPEWSEILQEGMVPVVPDKRLYASASGHVEDMLTNNYYSRVSRDGMTWEDRILDAGYPPTTCGETIGMLGFINFINPNDAALKLFEKMYENELDPAWTGQRNILNPDLREVGVSLRAGVYSISGSPWNTYMVVCDYGTDKNELTERILMSKINEARENPGALIAAMEIEAEEAASVFGDEAWVLNSGLPPLAWDDRLRTAALKHNLDMLEKLYFSNISQDGRALSERIADAGYEAENSAEVLGYWISESANDPWKIADVLFAEAARSELDGTTLNRGIFNPNPRELGIAVTSTGFDLGEAGEPTLNLMVADMAGPTEGRLFAVGRVFMDRNGDQTFDPGEEAPGLVVSLRNYFDLREIMAETLTDIIGGWQLPVQILFPFMLQVSDHNGAILYERLIASNGNNLQLDISISHGQ
ncbi:MAG: hypothetical protein GY859_17070 [Desulfobacterales bacterium]|nr:hypothetical protein [Desulfobacterales bacterium]